MIATFMPSYLGFSINVSQDEKYDALLKTLYTEISPTLLGL